MKVLYGASNTWDGNVRASRITRELSKNHDVRIAAYFRNHAWLEKIDWALDALRTNNRFEKKKLTNLFGLASVPNLDYRKTEMMLEDLSAWTPDLVISDAEPITSHIAYALDIELWSCSSLHLIDGTRWERSQSGGMAHVFRHLRERVRSLPPPRKRLIYSPFGDIRGSGPILRDGYEWVRPYHFINKDRTTERTNAAIFCSKKHLTYTTGETSLLSDCFYQNKWMAIFPDPNDWDQVLNGLLCKWFGIGASLGSPNDSDQEIMLNFDRTSRNRSSFAEYVQKDHDIGFLHDKVSSI